MYPTRIHQGQRKNRQRKRMCALSMSLGYPLDVNCLQNTIQVLLSIRKMKI